MKEKTLPEWIFIYKNTSLSDKLASIFIEILNSVRLGDIQNVNIISIPEYHEEIHLALLKVQYFSKSHLNAFYEGDVTIYYNGDRLYYRLNLNKKTSVFEFGPGRTETIVDTQLTNNEAFFLFLKIFYYNLATGSYNIVIPYLNKYGGSDSFFLQGEFSKYSY